MFILQKSDYKESIACDMCGNWVCLKCSNLSKTIFEEINSHSESTLKFNCSNCAPSFPKFSRICLTLNEIKVFNQERFDLTP